MNVEHDVIKLYGKTLRTWEHVIQHTGAHDLWEEVETYQWELAYKMYDVVTGEKIAVGSEDFQHSLLSALHMYRVFIWDGSRYNRGGCRWFEEVANVKIKKSDRQKLMRLMRIRYPDASEIQLR